MNKETFLSLGIESISQVYLGKDRHCRCGCGGEYIATSFMEKPRSDVDDSLVAKRLERAKKLISEGAEYEFGPNYLNLVTGDNRCLCFYFDDIKQK